MIHLLTISILSLVKNKRNMLVIDPKTTPIPQLHQYLVSTVAPRPIAFVSTIDENGVPNLAPYSFFNCFSSNPPILVFSSNRKVRGNTTKDTLHNVQQVPEVVINVVSYNIVRQMAVASVEYPNEVNEFEKTGFTPLASEVVKPFRVKESPVQMECRVNQIMPLGEGGGAGHLIICEVLRMFIDEQVLDEQGRVDPHRLDLMGRMGRAFYARASGEAVYTIVQDMEKIAIGYDQLPLSARQSHILTGNDLGQLAGMVSPPTPESIEALKADEGVATLLQSPQPKEALHKRAHAELAQDNTARAAAMVWLAEML